MPNDLQYQSSPYLKQHQNNPIHWHAWSEETLEKARREQKPIFLSIGYSSCHWCHVMEQESFNDSEVADLINQDFIAVIVDREERPDIDLAYMKAAQATSGQLGWPLNVFCTPDATPYYAATYLPKNAARGMPGLMSIVPQAARVWNEKKEKVLEDSARVVAAIREFSDLKPLGDDKLNLEELPHQCFEELCKNYDSVSGGFTKSPKFPVTQQILFLIKYAYQYQSDVAWKMAEKTLDQMAYRGLYDHIGGGFFRYAIDDKWSFPHFEKLLNDNALIAYAYTIAYKYSKKETYKRIATETLGFIENNFKSDTQMYYSACDADTNLKEGEFYLWKPDQIFNALGPMDGIWFSELFDINPQGNIPSPEGKASGVSHLLLKAPLDKVLTSLEIEKFNLCRLKLLNFRKNRLNPQVDTKKMTDWNSLLVVAFIHAGDTFEQPDLKQKGFDILSEIWENSQVEKIENNDCENGSDTINEEHKTNEIIHIKNDSTIIEGTIDDHAYFIWALWESYQSTLDSEWLAKLQQSIHLAMELFWDNENGGFRYSQDSKIFIQSKEVFDSTQPSANSVFAFIFQKMSHLTGEAEWLDYLTLILKAPGLEIENFPSSFSFLLNTVIDINEPAQELIYAPDTLDDFKTFSALLKSSYLPNIVIYQMNPRDSEHLDLDHTQSFNRDKKQAYLCEGFQCLKPWDSEEASLSWLSSKNAYLDDLRLES